MKSPVWPASKVVSIPMVLRYFASLLVVIESLCSSFSALFSSALLAGSLIWRLLGRLALAWVNLNSGTPEPFSGACGSGGGVALGGAGITDVIPSGPSPLLSWRFNSRRRSPAPPALGLNAAAADAAFHSVPARSPLERLALIMGPRPGRLSSGSGGGEMGLAASGAGLADALTNGVALVGSGDGAGFSGSCTGSCMASSIGEGSALRPNDGLRGDILSLLRGGGCGCDGGCGSRRLPVLINGAGTRLVSRSRVCGLDGSIGGRLLSGRSTCGGGGVGCAGGGSVDGVGGGGVRELSLSPPPPSRPKAPAPVMPPLERGGTLDASSLRVVVKEVATESWL